MNLLTKTLNKIFKSGNQQELDKIKPLVNEINAKEKEVSHLKDTEFKEKTQELKKRISGGENLDYVESLNYSDLWADAIIDIIK